jgi:O-antigen/teichoic acid export membrane protein
MQSSQPLTLRRNFSWTFLGNLIYAGCQWGMLIVLAKLGNAEMVGQFTLGLAMSAPVFMLSNLQLRAVQATDIKHNYHFGHYLALRLFTVICSLVFIFGLAIFSGYGQETIYIILIIGIAKAFESISDLFYGLFQRHERMDWLAQSTIAKGILSLLVLGSLIHFTNNLTVSIIGLTASWASVLVAYEYPKCQFLIGGELGQRVSVLQVQPIWDGKVLWPLVKLAFPLGFVMMLISLNTNIPRYFIESYLGQRELGIFAAMSYLPVAGGTVVNAFGQSALPKLSQYFDQGNRIAFWTLLKKLMGTGIVLAISGLIISSFCGRQILTVLYRPEYAEYTDVFVWVMVAAGFGYLGNYLGYGATATRAFQGLTIPYLMVTILSLSVSWLLIPKFGLIGAAWTLCVSSFATCIAPSKILWKS